MKGILFDKDGTLLDFAAFWVPVAEKAVGEICRHFGANAEVKNKILKAAGVGKTVPITALLCYGSYIDIGNLIYTVFSENAVVCTQERVLHFSEQAFEAAAAVGEVRPTAPQLKAVLTALKNGGAKLFVVTADSAPMTEYCLEKLGISDLFTEILAEDGIHPGKPNPYYIDYIADKYGFAKEEMCMVGDTVTDMQFAVNGKITPLGVASDAVSHAVLSAYTDTVAKDICDLFKSHEI